MTKQPTRQALGELLVERGLLTEEDLAEALVQQRAGGEFLGKVLVRRGLVQPGILLEVFAEQFGLPHESLRLDRVDWRVAKQFPASVLAGNRCFPIRADAQTVTVAISNPLDVGAISAIEKVTGLRDVQPVLVLERELEAVCRAYQKQTLRSLGDRLTHHGNSQTE